MANDYLSIGKAATGRKLNKVLDELKDDINKRHLKSDSLKELVEGLERIKSGAKSPKIKPLALYLDLIEMLRTGSSQSGNLPTMLKSAEVIYENLFLFGENTPEFEKTAEIFKVLAGENGLVIKSFFDPYLFASFTDKINYLTLVNVLHTENNALKIFDGLRAYALEARPFFIDDEAYMAYLLNLVSKMRFTAPDEYGDFLKNELWKLQRENGLYDIDPLRLAAVEKNVQTAALTIENGKSVLESLEIKSRELEILTRELEQHTQETLRTAENILNNKAKNARELMDAELKDYKEAEKNALHLEKDIFVRELFSDIESELSKYKAMAAAITGTAAADITSLSKDADKLISRLKESMDNEERLREYSIRSREDNELLEKIAKLQLLNDSMIDRLGKAPAQAQEPVNKLPDTVPDTPRPLTQHRAIPAVNPLLDRNVPFKERFALAMKEKERRMKAGEIFHEMFDDVLIAVMEEVNPYLIGPSGCGKTYMVSQIGEILNIDLSDIGYINEEYDILGYVTAMGEYSESNFYRLYKYGGIAFCDELDNGNSKATVKLNSFLVNRVHASYCFPGGERVEKHPNFRVIAAGNTDGSGADLNYSTRERIEESVQQRMIPIYVDYDNRVEEAILKDYPDWFIFACAFRKATDEWSAASGIPAQGIFTTRDAFRVKEYLDNGSFSPEKIMRYEFVQTKESEYLGFLKEAISKRLSKDSPAYPVYLLFAKETDRIRQNGRYGS